MSLPIQKIDEILLRTLDDLKLSRSERKALAEQIGEGPGSGVDRPLWRSRVFEMARSQLDPSAGPVLGWLEEVLKALEPPSVAPSAASTASVAFSPGDDCWREIVRRLENTRATADICVFTITDDRITSSILEAHRRRVAVRVLTDDQKAGDLGSDIDRLREAGVPVRTDRDAAHMHHKFAILDRQCLINGSYNWTRGAATENRENVVTTREDSLIARFQREFDGLWERFA